MNKVLLKDLKKGDLFCRDSYGLGPLCVRDHYDRSSKRYAYHYYYDYNREGFLKGGIEVYVP